MAKKINKWIQKAVPASHKGEFTDWCKAHGFNGPTAECIAKAKLIASKKGDKHLMGMAQFAKRAKKGF